MKNFSKLLILCVAMVLVAGVFFGCGVPEYTHFLPVVEITTQNNKLPNNKTDYVNSSFKLHNTGNDELYGFEVQMQENYGDSNSVGIRLRGNSTMGYAKKPYRIKFDKKQAMFGSAKNKNWVLLADYLDPSLIKNYTALTYAKIFDNMAWNATGTHVNVYINGNYKGVYLLCDQIDEKSGRLDLEGNNDYIEGQEDYPFLIEISEDLERDVTVDRAGLFNINSFVTADWQTNGSPAEIKYPEAGDGRTADATQYITNYVNDAFDALWAGDMETFRTLVDEDSFVDYVLLNELCSNWDAHYKSIYISKKVGEKMKFGPVWDFDGAFGAWTGNVDDTEYNAPLAFMNVYSRDTKFVRKYFEGAGQAGFLKFANRYNELYDQINQTYINIATTYKQKLITDAVYNQNIWYKRKGEIFNKNYDANMNFLINHATYLRTLFLGEYGNFMFKVFNTFVNYN